MNKCLKLKVMRFKNLSPQKKQKKNKNLEQKKMNFE